MIMYQGKDPKLRIGYVVEKEKSVIDTKSGLEPIACNGYSERRV